MLISGQDSYTVGSDHDIVAKKEVVLALPSRSGDSYSLFLQWSGFTFALYYLERAMFFFFCISVTGIGAFADL